MGRAPIYSAGCPGIRSPQRKGGLDDLDCRLSANRRGNDRASVCEDAACRIAATALRHVGCGLRSDVARVAVVARFRLLAGTLRSEEPCGSSCGPRGTG